MTDDQHELRVDRDVLTAIDDAFAHDLAPTPPQLTQFAVDALQWRLLDDELAVVTYDSRTDELVGIRGASTMRHAVRFEGLGISVAVSVLETSIVVSIEPAGTYQCRLEGPRTSLDTATDEHGQLAVSDEPLPLRLIVDAGEGRVVSPWITG
jgi:hypothetical protein